MRYSRILAVVGAMFLASPLAAQSTGAPVRIGVLNDQSGIYADLSGQGSVIAARMAVEDFGGTVLGRPIDVIFADHQNKPDVGSAIAARWYDTEGVDAIVDVPVSSVALAVQEIARERKRIVLFSAAGSSDLTAKACSPMGTQWTFDSIALAKGTASAVTKSGGTTWFFLTANYAFGTAMEADARRYIAEAGGEVLGSVRHPQGTTDFSSFLLQAQASKAKVIGLANAGSDTINALKGASEFGIVCWRPKACGHADFSVGRALAGSSGSARPSTDGKLLLGSERRNAGVVQTLRRADGRSHADHGPCRRLQRGDALPEGHQDGGDG